MKTHLIIFIFDDDETVKRKISLITKIVGENNICKRLNYKVPEVDVRCNKKQWKEIVFKANLYKTWY